MSSRHRKRRAYAVHTQRITILFLQLCECLQCRPYLNFAKKNVLHKQVDGSTALHGEDVVGKYMGRYA
jgi:hypothetical protein